MALILNWTESKCRPLRAHHHCRRARLFQNDSIQEVSVGSCLFFDWKKLAQLKARYVSKNPFEYLR